MRSHPSLLLGLSLWAVCPALAQPAGKLRAEDIQEMLEILNTPVISASKVTQKAGDAPATVVVVTEAQIRRRGYRSLLQVLEDLPDFKVERRTDPEWYHDVTVRGVSGTDTFVILLDGMRITASGNERIPIMENYPVHLARQIEIVYGPASALYGADAVSGVVNIITKAGQDRIEGTLGGGDGMRLANFHWSKAFGEARLTVAGQWFRDPLPDLDKTWADYNGFGSQRAGGPFPNPFFAPAPFAPSAAFDREPSHPERTRSFFAALKLGELDFRLFRNSAKVSSSLAYKSDHAIFNENAFLDQSVTVLGAQHTFAGESLTFQTSFTGSRYDLDPDSNFRNAFSEMEPGYKYAESAAWKVEEQLTWFTDWNATFVGGASYEVLQAVPWSTDLQAPVDTSGSLRGHLRGLPRGEDGSLLTADFFALRTANTAAYVQAQVGLGERLNLTAGARYDDNSRYGSTFNPRLGIVAHVGTRHTFKLLYGSAFLAPSPMLAYAHFGSFYPRGSGYESAFWRLPNPNLRPLQERTLEAGWQGSLAPFLGLSLSLYHTRLTDLHQLTVQIIDSDRGIFVPNAEVEALYPGNQYKGWHVKVVEIRTNLGSQRNTGGTLRADFLHAFGPVKVNAYAAYSRVEGKVDLAGNGREADIGLVAPEMLRGGLELQWGSWSLSARALRTGDQRFGSRDASGRPFTLPGYTRLDAHLLWDVHPRFSVYLDAANLTDERYRNVNHEWEPPPATSSLVEYRGQPQDPRRVGMGIRMKF